MVQQVLTAAGLWALLLPCLYLLGRGTVPLAADSSPLYRGIFAFAAGYGILVALLNLLSMAGLFDLLPVAGLGLLIMIAGIRGWKGFAAWLKDAAAYPFAGIRPRFLPGLLFFSLTLTAVLCFLPEVANDALCYQLNIPKEMVFRRSLAPLPFDFNSYTPILMNHLYAAALLFKSAAAAKLFHWWAGFFCAVLLVLHTEKMTGSRSLGTAMALTFLLMPTIANEMTSTYVDVAAAFFSFLAFINLLAAFENEKPAGFLGAGLMFGFAVATKVLHLISLAPFGILMLLHWGGKGCRRILQECSWFALGLFIACGWWFARNWMMEGNPVFPYLGNIFGTQNYDFVGHFKEMGPPKTFLNYLLLPLNLVIHPQDYDRGYWVGPAVLTLLPFFLYAVFTEKKFRPYGWFCWTFLTAWFLFFHNARFLTPVFPVFFTASAGGIQKAGRFFLNRQGLRRLALGAAFALLAVLLLFTVWHYRYQFKVLSGQWSQDQFLRNIERSYPAAEWVNEQLPKDARIYNAEEIRQFYFNRPMVRDTWFSRRQNRVKGHLTPDFLQQLREQGFTHILRAYPLEAPFNEDPVLQDESQVRKLVSIDSQNIREFRQRYEIFEILGGSEKGFQKAGKDL